MSFIILKEKSVEYGNNKFVTDWYINGIFAGVIVEKPIVVKL